MQPEPFEISTHVTIPANASEPINASQYGIRPEELHSTGVCDPLHEMHLSAESSSPANAIEPSSSRGARLHKELRRLSLGERNDTRPKPSYQRISEYENALSPSPPRKQTEGPGFKIVKKKANRLDGPQLDEFPNGMHQLFQG